MNVHANVEADQVGQFERAHRVIHAQLHHGVDGFGRGDAFHHRERGFVNHGHQDAICDEARRVVYTDGFFPELFAERHGGLKRGVARRAAADRLRPAPSSEPD